jgi:hypothetical protein
VVRQVKASLGKARQARLVRKGKAKQGKTGQVKASQSSGGRAVQGNERHG